MTYIFEVFLQICLVIAIVHCDNTTQSYKGTSANLINNRSTVNNGTVEKFDENSRVSKKSNDINSNNRTAHTLIDGKPRYFRGQIEVPYRSETKTNNNSHYVLLGQRRGVLIINRRMSRMSMKNKGSKRAKAESLLYEEYNDDGVKIYSYAMSSLDDVAKFFQYYLNSHICHGICENMPIKVSP